MLQQVAKTSFDNDHLILLLIKKSFQIFLLSPIVNDCHLMVFGKIIMDFEAKMSYFFTFVSFVRFGTKAYKYIYK
jgi:hypothetical protein